MIHLHLQNFQEDARLAELVKAADLDHTSSSYHQNFSVIAKKLGTDRTAKQCRERWKNFLRDGIKKGKWTREEESLINELYSTFGPR